MAAMLHKFRPLSESHFNTMSRQTIQTQLLHGPAGGVEQAMAASREDMKSLLCSLIAQKSISGHEQGLVQFAHQWAGEHGFTTDVWQSTDQLVAAYPQGQARHISLANRPTLVLGIACCNPSQPALIFNAHSDVVDAPAPERWKFKPWMATVTDDRIYGRGACDVKGPLVSALWAMHSVSQSLGGPTNAPVLLELVPGEEDAVGLGTLTSVLRGYRADCSIVLEPTESLPRLASRGGLRFAIGISGKAVHGTVKWLGEDAIAATRKVLDALDQMERDYNGIAPDPLFSDCPIARPITVDFIQGGQWQGMVADECHCAGYFELLPGDSLEAWQQQFRGDLRRKLSAVGVPANSLTVEFTETYRGHSTPPDAIISRLAEKAVAESPAHTRWQGWKAFNSGCEAGLRANLHNTPTLVWGPGSLAQAHAADEFVNFNEVERVAAMFARTIDEWLRLR